jgi:hypothetical protein
VDVLIEQWVNAGGDGLSELERATFYRVLEHISGNLRDNIDKNTI